MHSLPFILSSLSQAVKANALNFHGVRSVADCGLELDGDPESIALVRSLDIRALGPAVSGRSPAGGLGPADSGLSAGCCSKCAFSTCESDGVGGPPGPALVGRVGGRLIPAL